MRIHVHQPLFDPALQQIMAKSRSSSANAQARLFELNRPRLALRKRMALFGALAMVVDNRPKAVISMSVSCLGIQFPGTQAHTAPHGLTRLTGPHGFDGPDGPV